MKIHLKTLLILGCLISLLTACGQSGRLYLPTPETGNKADAAQH